MLELYGMVDRHIETVPIYRLNHCTVPVAFLPPPTGVHSFRSRDDTLPKQAPRRPHCKDRDPSQRNSSHAQNVVSANDVRNMAPAGKKP